MRCDLFAKTGTKHEKAAYQQRVAALLAADMLY